MKTFKILSIDAWGNEEDGYEWNNWHTVGELTEAQLNSSLASALISKGLLSPASKGKVGVEDDGYNYVIVDRLTREPLFAIEYGDYYDGGSAC
jgi:hypothetical protein